MRHCAKKRTGHQRRRLLETSTRRSSPPRPHCPRSLFFRAPLGTVFKINLTSRRSNGFLQVPSASGTCTNSRSGHPEVAESFPTSRRRIAADSSGRCPCQHDGPVHVPSVASRFSMPHCRLSGTSQPQVLWPLLGIYPPSFPSMFEMLACTSRLLLPLKTNG